MKTIQVEGVSITLLAIRQLINDSKRYKYQNKHKNNLALVTVLHEWQPMTPALRPPLLC